MALRHPEVGGNERILVFGPSGVGKSMSVMAIARLAARTKSNATFFYASTDRSVPRMLTDPLFRPYLVKDNGEFTNIVLEEVNDWESLMNFVTKAQDKMTPDDWLVIDLLTPAWQWAQDYFTRRIFGQDLDNYMITLRESMQKNPNDKENKMKRGGFEGFKDWPFINNIFAQLRNKIVQSPGHVYATAGIKNLFGEQADREQRAMFGAYGVLPEGQKHLAFDFQTTIWLSSTGPNSYEAITIKDRARPRMEGLRLEAENGNDFAQKYLLDIASWKLG